PVRRSTLLRYGVATLAVALVLLLKLLLDPLITDQSPFLLLAGAVMVAAWFGGLGPGLLATALGALAADYYFLPPPGAISGLGLPIFLFALQGLLISSLAQALRAARGRAEASAHEARSHQESLRLSEERFRLLVEGVKDYAIFMLDPEGRVATWNAGARRTNGFSEEEIIGEHFSVFYTEEDLKRGHPEEELRVASSEGRYQEEGLRVRKDGTRFWASVLITALRDEEGTLRGFSKVIRDITERKRAEEELRENEQRFRTLLQNSSDVITVIDFDGTIRYVSPAVERLMGYHPEELVGKSVYFYVYPEDFEEAQTRFARLWSQPGVHPPFEFKVPHKDGTRRYSEFIANNLLDDPSVRGVVVNQRDVTERREAEERLRESEALYRSVIEQAAENIFLVDAETKRVLEANAALSVSLGYAPDELEQLTLYDIVAHDREDVDRNTLRILEGYGFTSERRYRRKDGSLIAVEVNASAISYGGREVMCVVAHDVTGRKRTEEALRRSLDALLALYETGQVLSSSLELEEIGSRLLEIIGRVSGTTAAVINLRDDRGRLSAWRTFGPGDLLDAVYDKPEARVARRRASEAEEERAFEVEHPDLEGERLAGMLLPLRVRDRVIGVLEVYGPEHLAESGAMETFASLATQAASALENARLYEELVERERQLQNLVGRLLTAQEEERRRIAYDVHDGLAQTAAAAYQHLQIFARGYPPESALAREQLEEALELLRRTVGEARQVISDLRPTVLDDFGLAAGVRLQVENLRAEGWEVGYEEALGDERLPTEVETTLFRVAQEALTNVRKHARDARADVTLQRLGRTVRLLIRDEGRGFRPGEVMNGGGPGERVGLSGMRERISLLGGRFEIHSEPGTGTSVLAEVQLPATEEDGDHA
ncbi:MAG TPA: PAS domain S-box protein, partial [Rubrobacteraceae bacterium]|nr:PAS domain S-box protein [Rubrobacteraceae bacterium]